MFYLLLLIHECFINFRYAAWCNVERFMLIVLVATCVPSYVRNVVEFALKWTGACWNVDIELR